MGGVSRLIVGIFVLQLSASSSDALQNPSFKCVEDAFPGKGEHAVYKKPKPSLFGAIPGLGKISEHFVTDELAPVDHDEKVAAVYAAAEEYNLSPVVLAGAILQESGAADLGIGRDFDNWTCGLSQISVNEWCPWIESKSPEFQDQLGWPRELIAQFKAHHLGTDICAENTFIAREHVRPFQAIAIDRMKKDIHSKVEYLLRPEYLIQPKPIEFQEVAESMKQISHQHQSNFAEDDDAQMIRYKMTKSYAENCSNHKLAVPAMAQNLFDLPTRIAKQSENHKSRR